MTDILPVILSGGSGTRLWPQSREAYPKQFLPLVGEDTMLQATWRRVADLAGRPPMVVANYEHRFMVAEQLREAGAAGADVILEPMGRNTAPAIAVAALEAMASGEDALLLVLPSDHVIVDVPAFHAAVNQARADAGELVTFGIQPTAPETVYGYVKTTGEGVRAVEQFVEKPDRATAESYLASGQYFWNSGMFLLRASRYLAALDHLQPEILAACRDTLAKARRDEDFIRLDSEAFATCPSDSIDYAVMEKTADAVLVPLDSGWSDVGSWAALWEVSPQDADGNAWHGDVISIGCRNSYAHGERLIAMVGLEDVVVVDTDDALLVCHRDRIQEVKDIVGSLKRDGRPHARGTARSIARGVPTTRLTTVIASRSNASRSSRAARSACRCTTTAPSTGLWSAAPPR